MLSVLTNDELPCHAEPSTKRRIPNFPCITSARPRFSSCAMARKSVALVTPSQMSVDRLDEIAWPRAFIDRHHRLSGRFNFPQRHQAQRNFKNPQYLTVPLGRGQLGEPFVKSIQLLWGYHRISQSVAGRAKQRWGPDQEVRIGCPDLTYEDLATKGRTTPSKPRARKGV